MKNNLLGEVFYIEKEAYPDLTHEVWKQFFLKDGDNEVRMIRNMDDECVGVYDPKTKDAKFTRNPVLF